MRIYLKQLVVFLFFLALSAFQPVSSAIKTYVDDIESCPGKIFSLPVHFENLVEVDSFKLVLDYNPAALTYSGFENVHPDLFESGFFSINHTSGTIAILFYSDLPITLADSVIVYLRFLAVTDYSDFSWRFGESGYYLDGEPYPTEFINGSATIFPEIFFSLRQIPEEVCPESFDASFIATVSGGTPPYTYQWIGSPLQVLSDSIARNLATDAPYLLRITDDNGCVKDTIFWVKTRKLVEVTISAVPDTVFLSNPRVTYSAENLSDPFIVNYLWRFGDGDSISTPNSTIEHLYLGAWEYAKEGGQDYEVSLTVTDEFGCDTTIVYTILLREAPIFIPNVFTPNNDGANDEFKIVRNDNRTKIISEEYLRLELVVFNRWGRKLYSSDNYRSDWDGGNAPDGVYFYQLKAVGFFRTDTYKGSIHILR